MKTSDRKSKKLKSKRNNKSNPSKKAKNKKSQNLKGKSQKFLVAIASHLLAVGNLIHRALKASMGRTSGKLHRNYN